MSDVARSAGELVVLAGKVISFRHKARRQAPRMIKLKGETR